MNRIYALALASALGFVFLAPNSAQAIDNGPCDHCTMEPIVVKGDRKKTKSTSSQFRADVPSIVAETH